VSELADGRDLRWESHRERRRQLILVAAVAVIEDSAPGAELSIQDVADRAGLQRNAVHRYFGTRAGFNRAVQAHVVADGREAIRRALVLRGSVDDLVRDAVAAVIGWVDAHPNLHAVCERELGDGLPSELFVAMEALGAEIADVMRSVLVALGASPERVDAAALDLLAIGVIGQVRGTLAHWMHQAPRQISSVALTDRLTTWLMSQIDSEAAQVGVRLGAL